MIRTGLIFGGVLLVLGVTNLQIVQKERLLRDGTTILLELAPVDPRSLIQGDYMQLDYAITRGLADTSASPRDGALVVEPDENGVARLVRHHSRAIPLMPGEQLLHYRVRDGRFQVGTNAFFFQEGQGEQYRGARYGELKADASGTTLLVGLRDANRKPL